METPLTLGATLSTAPSLSEPHIQERWPFLPLLCDQMPQGPSPAPHWAQGPRAPWLPCPPQCLRAGPCCHPCFQLPGLTSEDRQLFGEQQDPTIPIFSSSSRTLRAAARSSPALLPLCSWSLLGPALRTGGGSSWSRDQGGLRTILSRVVHLPGT